MKYLKFKFVLLVSFCANLFAAESFVLVSSGLIEGFVVRQFAMKFKNSTMMFEFSKNIMPKIVNDSVCYLNQTVNEDYGYFGNNGLDIGIATSKALYIIPIWQLAQGLTEAGLEKLNILSDEAKKKFFGKAFSVGMDTYLAVDGYKSLMKLIDEIEGLSEDEASTDLVPSIISGVSGFIDWGVGAFLAEYIAAKLAGGCLAEVYIIFGVLFPFAMAGQLIYFDFIAPILSELGLYNDECITCESSFDFGGHLSYFVGWTLPGFFLLVKNLYVGDRRG